tara:strand:+ start:7376 stop:7741 length:366 start_codon:yes stop_codon:yes gene_type:complete
MTRIKVRGHEKPQEEIIARDVNYMLFDDLFCFITNHKTDGLNNKLLHKNMYGKEPVDNQYTRFIKTDGNWRMDLQYNYTLTIGELVKLATYLISINQPFKEPVDFDILKNSGLDKKLKTWD